MGQLYGYRVDGPYSPREGHRFNRHKLILDPYARAVTGNFEWKLADARGYDPSLRMIPWSPFPPWTASAGLPGAWSSELPLNERTPALGISFSDTIIYETHLRGFTCHPSSGIEHAGTFRGLVEKIPYLRELGVTAVELMPIMEFDEDENLNHNPLTGEKLKNYWGYSTISFLAPRGRYASNGTTGNQVREFREMVEALHHAGIEVILDVVINHTAEGDHHGPTLCFRGIDNSIYYILESDRRFYKNYSGCGNTFNCNHPIVRTFILDCLKYWVMEMKVDGFRFDLASILGRDQEGNMLEQPAPPGTYRRGTASAKHENHRRGVGRRRRLPGGRFPRALGGLERQVPRRCPHVLARRRQHGGALRHEDNRKLGPLRRKGPAPRHQLHHLPRRIHAERPRELQPQTQHRKRRGQPRRRKQQLSDNFGIEALAATPYIDSLRKRRIKNFIATLFLSQGVPMMLGGDEFRRTQGGNNNPWCQDNETSWLDWGLMEEHGEIFRFTREMIRFRKSHPVLRRSSFFTGTPPPGSQYPDISWHDGRAGEPDWGQESSMVACLINGMSSENGPDADIYSWPLTPRCQTMFWIFPRPPRGGPGR